MNDQLIQKFLNLIFFLNSAKAVGLRHAVSFSPFHSGWQSTASDFGTTVFRLVMYLTCAKKGYETNREHKQALGTIKVKCLVSSHKWNSHNKDTMRTAKQLNE